MKYKLKNNGKSWWVKGMVVEGEFQGECEILEIDSIAICRLNKDIMSKEQIIECMKYPRYGWGKAYLEPTIKYKLTMLEELLLERYLKQGFRYIVRSKCNNPYVYAINPQKVGDRWCGVGSFSYIDFKDLFQFVKWEDDKPKKIKDILDYHVIILEDK